MNNAYFYLFLIGALFPGIFLVLSFKDALDEYKHTGKFYFETLIGNPLVFFASLAAFVGLLSMAVLSLNF